MTDFEIDPNDPLAHLYTDALVEEAEVELDLPTRSTTLDALVHAEPETEGTPAERDVIALAGILSESLAEHPGTIGLDELDELLVDLGLADGHDEDGDPILNPTGIAVVKTILDRFVATTQKFADVAAEFRRRTEEAGPPTG